jgi:hypothetical protein
VHVQKGVRSAIYGVSHGNCIAVKLPYHSVRTSFSASSAVAIAIATATVSIRLAIPAGS